LRYLVQRATYQSTKRRSVLGKCGEVGTGKARPRKVVLISARLRFNSTSRNYELISAISYKAFCTADQFILRTLLANPLVKLHVPGSYQSQFCIPGGLSHYHRTCKPVVVCFLSLEAHLWTSCQPGSSKAANPPAIGPCDKYGVPHKIA